MINSNGYHIYKVIAQETRTADAEQQAKLKPLIFTHWLTELQNNSLVWQDAAALDCLDPRRIPNLEAAQNWCRRLRRRG